MPSRQLHWSCQPATVPCQDTQRTKNKQLLAWFRRHMSGRHPHRPPPPTGRHRCGFGHLDGRRHPCRTWVSGQDGRCFVFVLQMHPTWANLGHGADTEQASLLDIRAGMLVAEMPDSTCSMRSHVPGADGPPGWLCSTYWLAAVRQSQRQSVPERAARQHPHSAACSSPAELSQCGQGRHPQSQCRLPRPSGAALRRHRGPWRLPYACFRQ